MPSSLLPYFNPFTPASYAVPVQDEAAGTLTGCMMPDGRGLLVWSNANRIRGAITADPEVWLITDSVPSTDYFTVASGFGGAPIKTAVFEDAGELYIFLSDTVYDGDVTMRTYKCNDSANPDTAGWTAQAVIWTGYAYGSSYGDPSQAQASIPLILDSGRWVIANMTREAFAPPNENFTLPFTWVGYSDTKGASWTNVLKQGSGIDGNLNGAYLDNNSAQMLQDPNDGGIFWQNQNASGFVGGHRTFKSTNSGVSYTSEAMSHRYNSGDNGITLPVLSYPITNDTEAFALDNNGFWHKRNQATSGLSHYDWVLTGTKAIAPTATMQGNRMDPKVVIARWMYFFNGADKVMSPGHGGWLVGAVGIG